jgi:tRNA (cmo5U34)-methyltransferase
MDEIRRAFDAGAAQYDAQRRMVIPDFEGFYGAAVWAAAWAGRSPVILDIGAGTGLLSARILDRYPKASLTLLDISESMLDIARRRFQGRSKIHFLVADYSRESLGGQYDIIVSALSIHHLTREEKKGLYRRIFEALKEDGVFVHAEQVQGETAWTHRHNIEYWDDFIHTGGLPRDQREQIRMRRDVYDRTETLSIQLRWLQEIGFSDVDVIYKNRPFAVFSGRKRPIVD